MYMYMYQLTPTATPQQDAAHGLQEPRLRARAGLGLHWYVSHSVVSAICIDSCFVHGRIPVDILTRINTNTLTHTHRAGVLPYGEGRCLPSGGA